MGLKHFLQLNSYLSYRLEHSLWVRNAAYLAVARFVEKAHIELAAM